MAHDDDRRVAAGPEYDGPGIEVAPDVLMVRSLIVNLCMVGRPGVGDWVLIDAGLGNSGTLIREVAAERFGRQPSAILLTHGHFDHVGALEDLRKDWLAPVYAHELELPFLTGAADYPPAQPGISDGLIAKFSPLFPHGGIDLGEFARPLPADGAVPYLPDWQWLHTPGHSPGHVVFFRPKDRLLIAGDAFVTVKQESALAVMRQEPEVHGPPAYFTTDWAAAEASVRMLAELKPAVVVTGHGLPMRGEELSRQLNRLAENFPHLAVPDSANERAYSP